MLIINLLSENIFMYFIAWGMNAMNPPITLLHNLGGSLFHSNRTYGTIYTNPSNQIQERSVIYDSSGDVKKRLRHCLIDILSLEKSLPSFAKDNSNKKKVYNRKLIF